MQPPSQRPTENAPALECAGVGRSYRAGWWRARRQVLDGVDLRIEPGERWGLVGPNGSGKSTLLRIASGIEPPTSGQVRVFGGSLDEYATRARIGLVPEGFPFPGELDARSALELSGSLAGLPRDAVRARGAALLERVGLKEHARRRLGRFSRGMKQRFALAQALIGSPDLLLLDEPTAGLDAPGFSVLEQALHEEHERGAATLVCSHLVGDLVAHADKLAVLVSGKLHFAGTVADLAWRGSRLRVELEGIDEGAWPALVRSIEAVGGRVVERAPSNAALVELYRSAEAEA